MKTKKAFITDLEGNPITASKALLWGNNRVNRVKSPISSCYFKIGVG